jgi:hypothetical protein
MEIIDLCKNCATTECGHQFHSNCLMKSIAFNGFGCPYCRFEMVEEIVDSEDEEEYEDGEEREAGEDENDADEDGDGDSDSASDDDNDDDDDDDDDDNEALAINPNEPLPSFELIQKKFIEKGITYESLVKTIMFNSMIYHKKENFEDYQKCNTFMEELFFDIVTKYEPEQEEDVVKLNNNNNDNYNEFNFYFLQDEYSQREYSKKMETALEKFLTLDDDYDNHDHHDNDNDNDNDSNILDMNSFINDNFLNNRFMEVI